MKILSIAVPSYNVEQYLHKCLTSFDDERLEEKLEVIVVNDGSSDRTEEIANEYVTRRPNLFKLVNKENGGHGSAVNAGLDAASGKYFRIVDGDDWVITDNMAKLLKILDAHDSDIIVDEKREVHMITGETEFFPLPDIIRREHEYKFTDICADSRIIDFLMMHTMNLKTALLKKNGVRLREGIFYVDYEYIVKATCAAKTITFFDIEIYQYLIGNVNQSMNCANFVKRFLHHDTMAKEVLRYHKELAYTGVLGEYLDKRICLMINTHYNICLIYNTDRKEGLQQGKTFNLFLKENYPYFHKSTAKRYRTARFLHFLGVDYDRLQKIKK